MTRAVFLDLNGTLVLPVQPSSLSELTLITGTEKAIERLVRASYVCPIVTVQSRIAKGVFSEEEFTSWFTDFAATLSAVNAQIVGPYTCPHRFSEPCDCKKPKTLLYERAAADHDIDLGESWVIGDTAADIEAAIAFGGRGCLVRTGWGGHEGNVAVARELSVPIVECLADAVDVVLAIDW